MGVSTSLFLIAVGAILDFGIKVNDTSNDSMSWNVNTIGLILMIVGAIGLVVSLVFWNSWGGFHRRGGRYYDDRGPSY